MRSSDRNRQTAINRGSPVPKQDNARLRDEADPGRLIRSGAEQWNAWRQRNRSMSIQLAGAQLVGAQLRGADLSGVDLTDAVLVGSDMQGCRLSGSKLARAQLDSAGLRGANLLAADLSEASLAGAVLEECNLIDADLSRADLVKVVLGQTIFANTNLRDCRGLDTARHINASVVDFRTLEASGTLPLAFLRGCGVPDRVIQYLPTLLGEALQFYSVVLAYSNRDARFAERLHSDLERRGVRTWFAPHDLRTGASLTTDIDRAIRTYDKLLVVLSENSVASPWVEHEIETGLGVPGRDVGDSRGLVKR